MRLVAEGQPLELSRSSETPKIDNECGALIKVDVAGVCHSDLHLMHGSYDLGNGRKLPVGLNLPVTLGHEITGIVEEISPGSVSTTVRIGDRVVVYPWIGCGSCRKCLSGVENLCEGKPKFLGIFRDGGYSDYVMVPDVQHLVKAEGIDPRQSAPLACSGLTAYSAIKKCNLKPDDLILIIGAGGLGTTGVQISKKVIRARVAVLDVEDGKLELASKLGADYTFNSSKLTEKEISSQMKTISSGKGVDGVVDFVGIPSTSGVGFRVLGRGSTLVLVGLSGGVVELSLPFFPLRGAQVVGNSTGTLSDLAELVEIASKGIINPFVSAVYPLEDANLALEKLERGEVKGRVMLKP